MEPAAGSASLFGGKYRIERGIGQGPAGVVAEAVRESDGERVALKCLGPRFVADEAAVKRFARAIANMQKLTSVHAPRILDAGSPEVPYVAYELFEGSSVARLVSERGPLPMSAALRYALQACEVLAEAHMLGFTHGNLNLENWFSDEYEGEPSLKLSDFGMADSRLAGQPDAGVRSDVRGVGMSLHMMLTGELPGRGSLPDEAAGLAAIIDRCVDADPGKRYASMTDLALALAPVKYPPPSSPSLPIPESDPRIAIPGPPDSAPGNARTAAALASQERARVKIAVEESKPVDSIAPVAIAETPAPPPAPARKNARATSASNEKGARRFTGFAAFALGASLAALFGLGGLVSMDGTAAAAGRAPREYEPTSCKLASTAKNQIVHIETVTSEDDTDGTAATRKHEREPAKRKRIPDLGF